jgi:hypothetical protein
MAYEISPRLRLGDCLIGEFQGVLGSVEGPRGSGARPSSHDFQLVAGSATTDPIFQSQPPRIRRCTFSDALYVRDGGNFDALIRVN